MSLSSSTICLALSLVPIVLKWARLRVSNAIDFSRIDMRRRRGLSSLTFCISLNATARSGVKGTYGTDLTTIDFYCTISSYFMCLAWAKGAVVSLVERVSDVEKASLNIHT